MELVTLVFMHQSTMYLVAIEMHVLLCAEFLEKIISLSWLEYSQLSVTVDRCWPTIKSLLEADGIYLFV